MSTNIHRLTRRGLLRGMAASSVAALLPGCTRPARPGAECDPPSVSDIDWVLPDVARPVHFGVTDGEPVILGALAPGPQSPIAPPRPLLIYYPSASLTASRPILRPCVGRSPLVVFLHGDSGSIPDAGYHRRWHRISSSLARCGYVVAAPAHAPSPDPGDAALAAVARDVEWLRTHWSGSPWLDVRPASTSFVGHSWGALLAGRAASELPAAAFVSLGGGLPGSVVFNRLRTFPVPALYVYLDDSSPGSLAENLDGSWDDFAQPRWRAVYRGRHFDYLDPADSAPEQRGTECPHFPQAVADLVALFLGASVASLSQVDPDLRPPEVELTPRQHEFAVNHFNAIDALDHDRRCGIELAWATSAGAGSRILGMA